MNLLEVFKLNEKQVSLRSADWQVVIMSLEQMAVAMEDPKLGVKDTALLHEIIGDIKQQIGV